MDFVGGTMLDFVPDFRVGTPSVRSMTSSIKPSGLCLRRSLDKMHKVPINEVKQLIRGGWDVRIDHHPSIAEYHVILSKAGQEPRRVRLSQEFLSNINKEINTLMAEQEQVAAHIADMLIKYLKVCP